MEGLIRIRPLAAEDLDAVLAIQRASPEAAQWSSEAYRQLGAPAGREAGEAAWVGWRGPGPAGYVAVRFLAGEMEILNLAVVPEARRRGLGTALVAHVLAEGRLRRLARVFLEVREGNSGAIAFYERHGFVRAACRAGYYRHPDEDAWVLARSL